MIDTIMQGDCLTLLPTLPEKSVDLVLTSPPYAEQRKNLYAGISETKYPQWTKSWFEACKHALKDTASIVVIIRPHLSNGQISDYVLKTRLLLRESGWRECEELIWIKSNAPPIGSIVRPRRSWESILWFSLSNRPYCDAKANGQPSNRVGFVGKKGEHKYIRGLTHSENWTDKQGVARCRDYVDIGTGECDKSPDNTHPAQFPVKLAKWVINMLCPLDGLVVDPFMGSGSTAVACKETNRHYIGCELSEEYCSIANKRVSNC